jgi:hypothetical protein
MAIGLRLLNVVCPLFFLKRKRGLSPIFSFKRGLSPIFSFLFSVPYFMLFQLFHKGLWMLSVFDECHEMGKILLRSFITLWSRACVVNLQFN